MEAATPSAMHPHALSLPQERKRELVGGDPARFFALAQRCVWGVSEPGLVRVDVRRVVGLLVARYFWRQPGFLVDFVRYAVKSA